MNCPHPDSHLYVIGSRRSSPLVSTDILWCRQCGALKGWKPNNDNAPASSEWQPADGHPMQPNPFAGWFRWTVEFHVEEKWVGDGFDLTDRRAHEMLMNECSWMNSSECSAVVIARPPDDEIAKAQGYKSAEERRACKERV